MKNGFTLIELLGIIALLGIFMTVAIPSLVESNQKQKEKEKLTFKNNVEEACETYLEINSESNEELIRNVYDSTETKISISKLIEEGYLKHNIKNPYNENKTIGEQETVTASYNGNSINCTYTYTPPTEGE